MSAGDRVTGAHGCCDRLRFGLCTGALGQRICARGGNICGYQSSDSAGHFPSWVCGCLRSGCSAGRGAAHPLAPEEGAAGEVFPQAEAEPACPANRRALLGACMGTGLILIRGEDKRVLRAREPRSARPRPPCLGSVPQGQASAPSPAQPDLPPAPEPAATRGSACPPLLGAPLPHRPLPAARPRTKAQNFCFKSRVAFQPQQISLFTQTSLNLQRLCHSYTSGYPQCLKNLNRTYHTNPSKPSTKNIYIKLFTHRS